jgi:hypothetical protein
MEPITTDARDDKSGDWFLEAVGKAIEPPEPPAVLEPASETPDDAADAAPGTATETGEAADPVGRLEGTPDPLENWDSAELDEYMTGGRRRRWPMWTMLAIIVGAVAAALLLSPRLVERQAAAEAADYAVVLNDLRATLPATQQVLATVTEPDTPAEDLPNLVPDLSRLQSAAIDVNAAATRPLPEPIPLVPSDALDELQPSRDAMAELAADADVLADRLADAISYRSLIEGFLVVGDLPTSATPAEISDIQNGLAMVLSDATAVLAQLPTDPVFAEHTAALAAATDTFREWEVDYIAALSSQDSSGAERLLAEHELLLRDLDRILVTALAALRGEADTTILVLDQDIVVTIDNLPA